MDGAKRPIARRRAGLAGELALALPPTLTVLLMLAILERVGHQRLLFASLASSAFLVYLDPRHPANRVPTLVIAQGVAAVLGAGALALIGPGYPAAATAMVLTIVLIVAIDRVHPPAVSTALAFGFRTGPESNLAVFAVALGLVAALVLLQRASLWTLRRVERRMGVG